MKFSEHLKITPASIPVSSVVINGNAVDIYAPSLEDLCWLISKSADFQAALEGEKEFRLQSILSSIASSGPEIIIKLLSIALGEDESVIRSAPKMSIETQQDILVEMFEFGIPEDLRGKLMAVLSGWMAGAAESLEEVEKEA